MSSGKYAFWCPVALIRSSRSACSSSQIRYPYGLITMLPRTGPRSTSSARKTTSLYQAEKSSLCGVTLRSSRAMTFRLPSRVLPSNRISSPVARMKASVSEGKSPESAQLSTGFQGEAAKRGAIRRESASCQQGGGGRGDRRCPMPFSYPSPADVSDAGRRLGSAVFHGSLERGVVTIVLVGVLLSEVSGRQVELAGATKVGGQGDAVAGAGVCPGQGPPAQSGVGRQVRGGHLLDRHGEFPVLQLPHVIVAVCSIGVARAGPAEKDVAFGLHQVLPGDNALALVAVLAAPAVVSQGGGLGFLDLQEQGLGPVSGAHECYPAAGPDASHPDHLAGHLDQREVLKQVLAVGLQSALVFAQHAVQQLVDRAGLLIREDLLD